MNPVTLRRIAIISAVLTVLVAIDGIYQLVTRYNDGETQNFHLPDGATVLIAAALLLILTIIAFVLSNRSKTTASVEQEIVATPVEQTPVVEPVATPVEQTPVVEPVATPVETYINEPVVTAEPEVQG